MALYKGCEITWTWLGYEISKKDADSKWSSYLVRVYNGEPVWSKDYLYSRKYKTESGAKKVIDRFTDNKEVKR